MHPDDCRDWRGALGAAALDRLDPAESVALQAHLDGCAECRAELEELRGVADALSEADIERVLADDRAPPSELASRVLESVGDARTNRRRRRVGRIVAAAAALMVVVAATTVVVTQSDDDAPDAMRVVLTGDGAEASAELFALDTGTEVRLHATGLVDGEWYWLWVTDDDDNRVGAGTFRGTGSPVDLTMTAALPLEETHRVWVTDEDDAVVLDAVL